MSPLSLFFFHVFRYFIYQKLWHKTDEIIEGRKKRYFYSTSATGERKIKDTKNERETKIRWCRFRIWEAREEKKVKQIGARD